MKKYLFLFIIFFIVSFVSAIDFVPKQVIVKTSAPRSINNNRIGIQEIDQLLSISGVTSIKPLLNNEMNRYFVVDLETEPEWSQLSEASIDGISYIQPNYINRLHFIPEVLSVFCRMRLQILLHEIMLFQ